MKLYEFIKKINREEQGVSDKVADYLERYFSLYGEVEIKDFEYWENLGYERPGSNSHRGYYVYQETWLVLNGCQFVLLSTTYNHNYIKKLKNQ